MIKNIFIVITFLFPVLVNAQLKTSDGILNTSNIINSEVKQNYVDISYTTNLIEGKSIINESSELIDQNTIRFYSSPQFFFSGSGWYQIEYATTTITEYLKNKPTAFWWVIPEAIAQTFFPSLDGFVARDTAGETFASVRAGNGTSNAGASNIDIEANRTAGSWVRWRASKLVFDTSSIDDGATISSASLNMKTSGKTSDVFSQSVIITNADTSALATSDYEGRLTNMTTEYNRTAWASLSAVDAYTVFSLNASGISGINKTGSTGIGVRYSMDFDNSDPGINGDQEVGWYDSETAGTASDPYLDITLASGSSSSSSTATTTTATSTIIYDVGGIMFYSFILFFLGFIITLGGLNYIFL